MGLKYLDNLELGALLGGFPSGSAGKKIPLPMQARGERQETRVGFLGG